MGVSKVIVNGVTKVDLTQDTVASNNLLTGHTATGADGEPVSGGVANKTSTDVTVSGASVTIPAGAYATSVTKTVQTTTHPAPSVSINESTGLITATHTQATGYVTDSGTTTATQQLDVMAAHTYYPASTDQVISEKQYLTGDQTFKAVAVSGLTAANIKNGVTVKVGDSADDDRIMSVTGTYAGEAPVIESLTVTPTTSQQVFNGTVDGYLPVTVEAMPSGSVKVPDTSIIASPTITVDTSTGLITANNNKVQTVTPTITTGYVSSASASTAAGNMTVVGNNTKQLGTQGAQTLYPSLSDQTITSGKYLTGSQTFKAVKVTGLTAANIADGVTVKIGDNEDDDRIMSVTGTFQGGTDTSDATATAADIRSGLTAYIADGSKATGTYVPYLEFTNLEVDEADWTRDTTNLVGFGSIGTIAVDDAWKGYYSYKAAIPCTGVTADMFPYVEYDNDDMYSGYFGPYADTYAGGVYIYAAEPVDVTIPKITIYKRS